MNVKDVLLVSFAYTRHFLDPLTFKYVFVQRSQRGVSYGNIYEGFVKYSCFKLPLCGKWFV